MDLLWVLGFAFLVGLTVAGFCGSAMEIVSGSRLRLAPPFIARDRIALSLAASLAAGPFMLVNEALDLWTGRRIGWAGLTLRVAIAMAWSLATGIVATELAILMVQG